MITELIQYLTTPCSWRVRKWGYLSESIGIRARYRRCQKQWQPHLQKTEEAIVRFLESHPEIKSILFCGSGAGFDIPWASPSLQALERIVLVDLVHPWSIRWRAFRDSRIEFYTTDLSGVMDQLEKGESYPIPRVDWRIEVDCAVSLNLLSQLPILPLERMERLFPLGSEEEHRSWARRIQKEHLDLIARWGKDHLVIADLEERWVNREGEILEVQDPCYGGQIGEPEEQWEWMISPEGEIDPERIKIHQVGLFSSRSIVTDQFVAYPTN